MANNQPQTLADYVAIAISPALIMALVVSLVFFLVEVLLGPSYPSQLLWILFFFVFGSVLASRISMMGEIADRAALYGLVLVVLGWIALRIYVKYPADSRLANADWLVNGMLIVIIWWSSYRLTWDSTLIDDKRDASGAGLMQVAGLENDPEAETPVPDNAAEKPLKKPKKEAAGLSGWVHRYLKHREEVSQRPHAPGVWVVYFSLAALPLFGLGQSLIPPGDVERRRYAFWLMVVYVGSGLGLLLTTSFLNLRRYLRQRGLQMPMAMTGVWLTGGTLIVAILLALGALLPRPSAEYPIVNLGGAFGIKEREGSRHAKGKAWAKKKDGDPKAGDRQGEGEPAAQPRSKKDVGDGTGDDPAGKAAGQKDENAPGRGPVQDDGKGQRDLPEEGELPQSSLEGLPDFVPTGLDKLLDLLKWILGILFALVILFLVLRALVRFLANFTYWANGLVKSWESLWQRLLGLWQSRVPEGILDDGHATEVPPPFSAFSDPFLLGGDKQMSPADIVRYAFEALEAWAWERGLPRQAGETPFEFVSRLAADFPALEYVALDLANLYASVAYAKRLPTPERLDAIKQLWFLLQELAERPMSAGV